MLRWISLIPQIWSWVADLMFLERARLPITRRILAPIFIQTYDWLRRYDHWLWNLNLLLRLILWNYCMEIVANWILGIILLLVHHQVCIVVIVGYFLRIGLMKWAQNAAVKFILIESWAFNWCDKVGQICGFRLR